MLLSSVLTPQVYYFSIVLQHFTPLVAQQFANDHNLDYRRTCKVKENQLAMLPKSPHRKLHQINNFTHF